MKINKLILVVFSFALQFSVFAQTRDTTYYIYQNLGENVNTPYNESGPRISPDGNSLYFFRIDHPDDLKESNDIWVSHLTGDSSWSLAERLGEPLNNYADNAVHSISEDGKKLLVHDIYLKNYTSKSGISISEMQDNGQWSFPKPLKFVKYENLNEICSFYLSDDWETLILAIETSETVGKQDLYVSFHDKEKDIWSEPKDLGKTINSAGAEATAFLASDQTTLYFSSDGHTNSLGGFDIYKSTRLDDTWMNWSTPENLGKPFNTADDEFYFSTPSHAGGWVYLAHSHHHGNSDITRIKKVTEPLPDPILNLFGFLYDKSTNKTLSGDIKFTLVPNDSLIGIAKADTATEYKISLKGYKSYTYSINKDGYEEFKGTINLSDLKSDGERRMDIYLTPIPRPEPIVLKDVEFETGKWDILPKFTKELDKAYDYLLSNPDIKFEISGHTDNVGTEESNQILSQNRANAVKQYLVKKGIPESRLTAVGYGESKPIASNDSAEGKQRNRRVELVKL